MLRLCGECNTDKPAFSDSIKAAPDVSGTRRPNSTLRCGLRVCDVYAGLFDYRGGEAENISESYGAIPLLFPSLLSWTVA